MKSVLMDSQFPGLITRNMFELNQDRQRQLCHDLTSTAALSLSPPQVHLLPYEPANEKLAEFHASTARIKAIFGGNRSGKSHSGCWQLLKRCQTPNTVAWACSLSNEMNGTILFPKIKSLLDPESIQSISWLNRGREIPAELTLVNGSKIYFKSAEQGPGKFQGTSIDIALADEEIDYAVYREISARLVSTGGTLLLAMTPLKGLSWPYEKIFKVKDDPEIAHWTISLFENKFISEKAKTWFESQLTEDERDQRIEGLFKKLTGSVWKELTEVNIIPRFTIPHEWRKIRAIDWGFVNPLACLWVAMGADKESLYVYQEYYQAGTLLKYHAESIQELDEWGLSESRWKPDFEAAAADHDSQDRAEFENYGIPTIPAEKDVQLGIQTVNRLLKTQPNGRPILYIFDDLEHTLEEANNYHYEPQRKNKNAPEQPAKVNDHTQDALRYACMYFYDDFTDALDFGIDGIIGADPLTSLS